MAEVQTHAFSFSEGVEAFLAGFYCVKLETGIKGLLRV